MVIRIRLGWLASLAALACACGGPSGSPGETGAPPSSRAAPSRSAAAAPSPVIDLEAMLAPVPEYEGIGRNLFAYGAERMAAVPEPAPGPIEPPPRSAPAPAPPPPRPAAPAARLDVKYAGFLEKTADDGGKAKYAIFLDGNEILAGAEGETVANRFTVVEIGLESVTVSASGTNVTQRIPLQSN